MHCPLSAQDLTSVGNRHILTAIDFVCDMSTFKKLLGFGAEEDKSQSSSRQPTSAVSGEHSGSLSSAAQKASNLVPATIAERDDANDQTVCQKESQKSRGTWEAAKEATMEAEKQGAEAHLKSCEAEHLLATASELTQTAASARAREEELREKAALAKSEAGGLAPLAHDVLEAQKEEQHRASELAALKRENAKAIVDVETTTGQVKQAQSVVPPMERLVQGLEKQQADTLTAIDNTKTAHKELDDKAQIAEQALINSQSDVEKLQAEFNEASGLVQQKEQELREARLAAEQKAKQLDVARNKAAAAAAAKSEMQAKVQRAEQILEAQQKRADEIASRLATAIAELQRAKDSAAEKESALLSLQAKADDLASQVNPSLKDLQEAQAAVRAKRAEVEAAKVRVAEATRRFADLQKEAEMEHRRADAALQEAERKEAAWRDAQAAAEAARKIEHDKWAQAQRLGKEADEATAERLSVMRERVTELKEEMGTVKEEITVSSSSSTTKYSSSSSSRQLQGTSTDQVDVKISGKGDKGVSVKVAAEE